MLVLGGATSLWGAVLGALAMSGLDSFLGQSEQGIDVGISLDLPTGHASHPRLRHGDGA